MIVRHILRIKIPAIFLYLYKHDSKENEVQILREEHDKVLNFYQIPSIDVYRCFKEHLQRSPSMKKVWLRDEHHLTEMGANFACELIMQSLEPLFFEKSKIYEIEDSKIIYKSNLGSNFHKILLHDLLGQNEEGSLSLVIGEESKCKIGSQKMKIPGNDRKEIVMIDVHLECEDLILRVSKKVWGIGVFCGVGTFSSKIQVERYLEMNGECLERQEVSLRDEHCYYMRSVMKILLQRRREEELKGDHFYLKVRSLQMEEKDLPKLKKQVVPSDRKWIGKNALPILYFSFITK